VSHDSLSSPHGFEAGKVLSEAIQLFLYPPAISLPISYFFNRQLFLYPSAISLPASYFFTRQLFL
jgi:hypothetical protein